MILDRLVGGHEIVHLGVEVHVFCFELIEVVERSRVGGRHGHDAEGGSRDGE